MKKRIVYFNICIIILLFFPEISFSHDNPLIINESELEVILNKCAEYCEKLNNMVLDFVCIEDNTEVYYYNFQQGHFFVTQLIERRVLNSMTYDFQLIHRNQKILERRFLLEANGKKFDGQHEAPLLTQRFEHKRVVFGPVGLLSRYWQLFFDYKMIGREIWDGIDTHVIEAIPKDDKKVEHLYGKIWVAVKDHSILKIEWNPSSLGNYYWIQVDSKKFRSSPIITFSSEYGFEKNGIRFPSKYTVKEEYRLHNDRLIEVLIPRGADSEPRTRKVNRFTMYECFVLYKDYKFFTVEVDIKHK